MDIKRKLNEVFDYDGELFKCTDDDCHDCIVGRFPKNSRCDCSECTGQRIEKIQLKGL